jgi:predicted transcriptional regulator
MDTPGLNDLLTAILNSKAKDVIPPGWYSVEQMVKSSKIGKTTMQNIVKKCFDEGMLERNKFRITLNGRMRQVYYYKKKQGKA